jgi:hypothetical protein
MSKSRFPPCLIAAWLLLSFGIFFYAGAFLCAALSNVPIEIFDSALRILPHFYAAQGLAIYRDFNIVYPPGIYFLYYPLRNYPLEVSNFVLSCLVLGLHLLTIRAVAGNIRGRITKILAAAFLLVLLGCGYYKFYTDMLVGALTYAAMAWTLRGLCAPRKLSKIFLLLNSAAYAAIFILRWDRAVALFGMQILFLALIEILARKNLASPLLLSKTRRLIAAQTAGIFFASASIATWLYLSGTLSAGLDMMFNIPLRVIGPYRKLPLKLLEPQSGFLWGTIAAYVLSIATFLQRWRGRRLRSAFHAGVLSMLLPLSMLPYALGRADLTHQMPIFCLAVLMLLHIFKHTADKNNTLVITAATSFLLFIPVLTYTTGLPDGIDEGPKAMAIYQRQCASLAKKAGDYKSVFVGRASYKHFIASNASLYLIDPSKPPATPFISDEPGLQNSCKYGGEIAGQLSGAPKPMLAFLELSPQFREDNLTERMSTCGKIERFLASAHYEDLGRCNCHGYVYAVLLYK